MASQIKVDELAGAAGTTITIPVGQTLDILGTLDIDSGTLILPNFYYFKYWSTYSSNLYRYFSSKRYNRYSYKQNNQRFAIS